MGSHSETESEDITDSEIDDYQQKPYEKLKAGKYKIRNPNTTFRCPFCPGKRKQEYQYRDLLQHASGVGTGSSNRSAKQKANHLAMAKYMKEDLNSELKMKKPQAEPEHSEEVKEDRNNLVDNLVKELDNTNSQLDEMHNKYNEMSFSMNRMIEENDKLHQAYNEEMERMQSAAEDHTRKVLKQNEDLKYELESKRRELECWSKELCNQQAIHIHKRRSIEEETTKRNKSLHLALVNQTMADNNVSRLLEKQQREKSAVMERILNLEKELDAKQKLEREIQEMKGQLRVLEYMVDEHDRGLHKKMETMEEGLKDKIEELEGMEDLKFALETAEGEKNDQLQAARQEMIAGLTGLSNTTIGVKRLGELSAKSFQKACKERYPAPEAFEKSEQLCKIWQEYIQDPNWNPFKVNENEGNSKAKDVIDEEDARLKKLRKEWGEEAHMAVVTAMKEMNEYNPIGRSVVPELWNFEHGRKAPLKEAIAYLRNEISSKKRKR